MARWVLSQGIFSPAKERAAKRNTNQSTRNLEKADPRTMAQAPPGEGDQEGKKLVGGHEHEVVEPGLLAAAVVVLGLPVVDGAPGPATETLSVRPQARHEGDVDDHPDSGGGEPGARAPGEAGKGGDPTDDDEGGHEDSGGARRGVGADLGVVKRARGEDDLKRALGEGGEKRKGERACEHQQVAGAGQVAPGGPAAQPLEVAPKAGEHPGKGVEGGGEEEAVRERVGLAGLQVGGRQFERKVAVEVEQEEGDEEEGRFLGAEGEGEGDYEDDEPARPSVVEVAPHGHNHEEDEEGQVDIHAQKAAEVDDRRREGEERHHGERSHGTEPAPQGERDREHGHTEQGRRDTGGVVGGGEDEEREALHEVEQGAVKHRVVGIRPWASLQDQSAWMLSSWWSARAPRSQKRRTKAAAKMAA